MALERTYIIPLRKEWLKAPRYKRAKKAVNAIKKFLARHMKSEDIKILKELNLEVWKHGIKNPPGKVKVDVLKDDKGVVRANLSGFPVKEPEKEEKKKKSKLAKAVEKLKGKPAQKKQEEVKKEEKKEQTELEKKVEKKEIKVKDIPKEEAEKSKIEPEKKSVEKEEAQK